MRLRDIGVSSLQAVNILDKYFIISDVDDVDEEYFGV